MRSLFVSMFVIIACSVGCTNEKQELDQVRKEISDSVIGNPDDKRYSFVVSSYDQSDEDASQESESFTEPTPELIRAKVNALPWNDKRFVLSASLGQGSIFFPEHRAISITNNTEAEEGGVQPLIAEIDEAANGELVRKSANLDSPDLIAELLIAYLNKDEAGLAKVEWTERVRRPL